MRAEVLRAIMETPPEQFRAVFTEKFRGQWFDMPAMGMTKIDTSRMTKRAGLGVFNDGLIVDDAKSGVAIFPAWDNHGDPKCSLCHGLQSNEFSFGSDQNTHTFCFRCVFAATGDDAHVLENLLFFANHLPSERSNGTWSKSKQCRKSGRVPIVRIKQCTFPVHGEFFLTYGHKPDAAKDLFDDRFICVGHPGGPSLNRSRRKCNSAWRLCQSCVTRLRRLTVLQQGVCGHCNDRQVGAPTHPVCAACLARFEDFVWKRTGEALAFAPESDSENE